MIYNRWGEPVTIVRRGTLADVTVLDSRKPDQVDRDAVKQGSYWVVVGADGHQSLYHLGYLRADDGSAEITRACEVL